MFLYSELLPGGKGPRPVRKSSYGDHPISAVIPHRTEVHPEIQLWAPSGWTGRRTRPGPAGYP